MFYFKVKPYATSLSFLSVYQLFLKIKETVLTKLCHFQKRQSLGHVRPVPGNVPGAEVGTPVSSSTSGYSASQVTIQLNSNPFFYSHLCTFKIKTTESTWKLYIQNQNYCPDLKWLPSQVTRESIQIPVWFFDAIQILDMQCCNFQDIAQNCTNLP